MTDKEKLEKIKALADKMYSRMSYLTSDTRPIRQAMDEYHQFIIYEYYKEEPVSIDFEQELYKAFGQVKDFTLGMRIAKRFYEIGRNYQEPVSEQNLSNVERTIKNWKEEPVSEDLDSFAIKYAQDKPYPVTVCQAVKVGANWQKHQMMKDAVGGEYLDNNIILEGGIRGMYDGGDKVKIILIKE